MTANGEREARLEDYSARREIAGTVELQLDAIRSGTYIPVHPFADACEALARLAITPADCKSVDVYFKIDDVYFVQVVGSKGLAPKRSCGLYVRISPGNPAYVNFMVVSESTEILKADVEYALTRVADTVAQGQFHEKLTNRLVRL